FRKFRSGDFDFKDNEGHGRRNELDEDELKALMDANTRTSAQELAEQLILSVGIIFNYLNRIGRTK
ncbi:hypothetical protein Angca_006092, partial [Angiostrongylus cantonensis]